MSMQETIEHDLLEIDPRPCEWCGLTIDQHRMVDTGEGPEFFCEEMPSDYAADLVRGWELADPRDRWKHTGEPPPHIGFSENPISTRSQPYRTAQSTIDAFWYVVRNESPEYLKGWLERHSRDAAFLLKIWKAKPC
jgi:hypothetical protein